MAVTRSDRRNQVLRVCADANVVGTYPLHYNVTDAVGNPAEEKTRTVKVVSPFGVTRILAGPGVIVVTWDSGPEATIVSQEQTTDWVDLRPPATCGFYRIERTD